MNSAQFRKLRQLQQEMMDTQKEIEESEFTANCGPVSLTMLGTKEVKSVRISKDFKIEDDSDLEILEDSFVAANNQLINEINNYTNEKMSKYTAVLGKGF
jgi:hypothetical protein